MAPTQCWPAEQEGEPDDGAGGQGQLGRIADEEVPPEEAEGPDCPRHRGHCVASSGTDADPGAGSGSSVRM